MIFLVDAECHDSFCSPSCSVCFLCFSTFLHSLQHPLLFSPHRLSLLVPPHLHLTDYAVAIILLSTSLTTDTVELHCRIWGSDGKALRIAHINIRSLVSHFPSIIDLFRTYLCEFDTLAISETCLKETNETQ